MATMPVRFKSLRSYDELKYEVYWSLTADERAKVDWHRQRRRRSWRRLYRLRSHVMRLRGYRCEECEEVFEPGRLHLHHLSPDSYGRETAEDVELLCALCHARKHPANGFQAGVPRS